ncbi:unnamed protein product [Vitrella brassicaformis CCMP3155]|uniref:Cytochrome b5 heme-binding domain-containing protein n=1 Tax=Vitrella brassicaformis (strain CCMP3155) TaxID=1169540 RepID=A0A0G4EKH5_VITBC|nr:unnamed protein product [Vitrella brassicaformis CCMP3155]|eukprot:CEL97060.1 unnamed protein product [Vitrella brassicaformis CCMP3155]
MCKQASPRLLPASRKAPPASGRVEIQVRDRIYDITDFVKRHPGGSVIAYYANQDATDAYVAFHQRSPRADKILKSLPSRPADKPMEKSERAQQMLADYRKLRSDLVAEGWFKPDLAHVAFRIVEIISMFVVSFVLLKAGTWWSVLLSMFIGGLAGGRSGWIQHEGGHHSLTGIIPVDKAIQTIFISFGLITYGWKWNHMHNKHHATPQKEDHDLDVDTLPFVAFYKDALERGRRAAMTPTWWIRYQHLTFLPLTSVLNVFFWHFYLHPKEYILRKGRRDPVTLLFVILRYVAHFYSCPSDWSILMCLSTFYMTMFVSGVYLFGNFSLNHTHLPTTRADEHKNWVEYGIDYTINVDPNPFVNWWMGYLNCQVEHHLFPSMPQYRQPQLVPRIRQFCEDHGLTYQSLDYITAVKATLGNLKNVAEYAVEREMDGSKKAK